MEELHREPRVENKYSLTISNIRKLKILATKEQLEKGCGLWRNNVIGAWCICGIYNPNPRDHYETFADEYWLGFYDKDAKSYAGKTRVSFSSYGGMCGYNFTNFYNPKEIENETDLRIQEMFLEEVNNLIDKGIIGMGV